MKKFRAHVKGCTDCQSGTLCEQGKVMMVAAMDAPHDGDEDDQAGTQASATARASFTSVVMRGSQAIPDEIQWMPPGEHRVTPSVNGEPKELQLMVNAQLADLFSAKLQSMRQLAAAGGGDLAFIDFNHDDDASAGEVLDLYWAGEDPKAGGIRAKVKWSAAGRAALEGRNYRRFSPQWELDPETLEPLGLRENLGGLVNRAAFKNIAPVVAKDAGHKPKETKMDRKEFQELLAEGLKPINEKITALEAKAGAGDKGTTTAQAAAADEKTVKLIGEVMKPFTDKITTFETAHAAAATATAKSAVMAHVGRGAIAPADTESISYFTTAYAKDPEGTEKILGKLPGRTFTRIISSGGSVTATAGGEPEHQFMAKAKEFAKANNVEGGEAGALSAFARTSEGRELYAQFRGKIVPRK